MPSKLLKTKPGPELRYGSRKKHYQFVLSAIAKERLEEQSRNLGLSASETLEQLVRQHLLGAGIESYEQMNGMILRCPACGKSNYSKHRIHRGIQRYKCQSCGRTFQPNTALKSTEDRARLTYMLTPEVSEEISSTAREFNLDRSDLLDKAIIAGNLSKIEVDA